MKYIVECYCSNKICILMSISLMAYAVCVVGMIKMINRKYILKKWIHNAFLIIMVHSLGYFASLFLNEDYYNSYINVSFCVLISGLISSYAIYQMVFYKNTLCPIIQACKYISGVIYFEVFILSANQCLERCEAITGTGIVLGCYTVTQILDDYLTKNEQKEANGVSDYPIDKVVGARRNQLDKFKEELKVLVTEPYAIMIAGEWGVGKTSFVKAFEKESESPFIWIWAGSEKTVREIMLDLSNQMLKILDEHNILVEREDVFDKYFLAFSEALKDSAWGVFSVLMEKFIGKREYNYQEYIVSAKY